MKPGWKSTVFWTIAALAALCFSAAAPAGEATHLLPWRDQIERRLRTLEQEQRPPQIDEHRLMRPEEIDALRRRIGELELELHKQRIGHSAPPRQELPIPGAPKQELPGPGMPKQDLPAPGPPRQDLPSPGGPKQELPARPMQPAGPPLGYQRFTTDRLPLVLPPDIRLRPPQIIATPSWR